MHSCLNPLNELISNFAWNATQSISYDYDSFVACGIERMKILVIAFISVLGAFIGSSQSLNLFINFDSNNDVYKVLPRFWTNSGFSPSASLPFNRSGVANQLQSPAVYQNLEFVAALPNSGIQHIRIHWLLTLVEFR